METKENEHYRETSYTTMLREFHDLTQNDWHEEPIIPDQSRLELRSHLIVEEAREFEKAAKERNLVEMADGLIDLLYVTFGSIGELGLGNIVADLFEEVHRSNMSKLCKTEQEAKDTVSWYGSGVGVDQCEASYRFYRGFFIVYRISDGKTLKNKNYSPANISGIIETHLNKGDDQDWANSMED